MRSTPSSRSTVARLTSLASRRRQQRLVEAAGDGAAAEIGRGEPYALLLGKADHVEMKRQSPAGSMQMLGDDQRRQYAEAAVKLAGIGDRVVVRTDNQRFCAPRPALA